MPQVCVVEFIQAEADAVYELFCDLETFPQFMANVVNIQVVERGDGWSVSHWDTELDGAPLSWREVDQYDPKNHVIDFCLVEGDIAKFEGRWSFQPCDGGTACTCELEYELGVSIIEDVVGPTIREKIKHNIAGMLQAANERLAMACCN